MPAHAAEIWSRWHIDPKNPEQKQRISNAVRITKEQVRIHAEDLSAIIQGASGQHHVNLSKCDCMDFIGNLKGQAPCKHMFRLAMEFELLTSVRRKVKKETLQSAAIKSAALFYDISKEEKSACRSIGVRDLRQVSPDIYAMRLAQKIKNPDTIRLEITSPLIDEEFIDQESKPHRMILHNYYTLLAYNEEERTVQIQLKDALIDAFSEVKEHEVFFVSDLLFLIKNVQKWYEENGHLLRTPNAPRLSQNQVFVMPGQSAEQLRAVQTALQNPTSYIWGAPGTGKTQYVLTAAVLSYVQTDRPIMILAPTNNAIEQVLRSVIAAMEKAGISRGCMVRHGIPSAEFAAQYGDICERADLKEKLLSIDQKIENLSKTLAEKERLKGLNRYLHQLSGLEKKIQSCHRAIDEKSITLDQRNEEHAAVVAERIAAEETVASLRAVCEKDTAAVSSRLQSIKDLRAEISQINYQESAFVFKLKSLFSKKEYLALEELKTEKQRIILHHTELLEKATAQKAESEESLKFAEAALKNHEQAEINISAQIASLTDELEALRARIKQLNKNREAIFKIFATYNTDPDQIKEALQQVKSLTAQIEDLTQSRAELAGMIKREFHIKKIYAGTVDWFISNFSTDPDDCFTGLYAQHIFLDEAAYLPLIKAGPLFSLGKPVTLFGDHMQLPPIFGINEKHLEKEDDAIFLWAQSALYFPELLEHFSLSDAFQAFISETAPSIPTASVTKSFRYGNNLAVLLNRFVYHTTFSGMDRNTVITVIDAGAGFDDAKNENHAELKAIRTYIHEHSLTDFSILVPYRAQMNLLRDSLPEQYHDQIMTIHAAQGREWNMVILSVTEKSPWFFMNSKNSTSRGLQIINTAISRAKEEIVIVCNKNGWIGHEDQLIGQIIASSV